MVPPTDLESLARDLGVEEIRDVPLSMRGRIVVSNGIALAIEVNESLPELDRRFTIAHEIGHLILEPQRMSRSAAIGQGLRLDRSWEQIRIEQLCDQAAAEMLIPTDWLLANQPESMTAALKVAARAGTNIDVLAPRLIDLGAWAGDRLLWVVASHPIVVRRAYPDWDEEFLVRIEITHDPDRLISTCSPSRPQLGRLSMSIADEPSEYRVEVVSAPSNLVLLRLLNACPGDPVLSQIRVQHSRAHGSQVE